MYVVGIISKMKYDPDVDIMYLMEAYPSSELCKDAEDINLGHLIVHAERNLITAIKILDASETFKTAKEKLIACCKRRISYTLNSSINIIEVFFYGVGGIRGIWNHTNTVECNYISEDDFSNLLDEHTFSQVICNA
jgi:uncharacterized protein YuzE